MNSPIARSPSAWYPSPATPAWLTDRPISRLGDHQVHPAGTTGQPLRERRANVVGEYVANSVSWWRASAESLDGSTTAGLQGVLALNVPLLAWVVAVLNGTVECSSWACSIATFGDRPWLLLGLAGGCVAGLTASAVVTRGLTRAGALPLGVMGMSGLAGVIAPLGVIAVAVIVVVVVGCALALFAFLVDRF